MSKVYIYQSCNSVASFTTKMTQVIQTSKLDFIDLPNSYFKDSIGNCWFYLSEEEDSYIPPKDYFSIFYSGNYFTNAVKIFYPDCNSCSETSVKKCEEVYFQATRCDSGTTEYVKVCNVKLNGPVELLPKVGDKYAIYSPNTDDFCVTLEKIVQNITTDYEIITPSWQNQTCENCSLFRKYIVDSCDGYIVGLEVYDDVNSDILNSPTSINISTDSNCYIIVSYEGIYAEYNYSNSTIPIILQTFDSCNDCLINLYNLS